MKRMMNKRVILFVLLGFILVYGLLAFTSPGDNHEGENPFLRSTERPLLIAHGGGNHEFPDNTLEAYYNAYSVDTNVMMETDISITNDGVIILSHDRTLDRKTSLTYAPIHEINYSDLVADEIDFGFENVIVPRSNGFNESGELIRYRNYQGETVTPLDVIYPEGVEARHETKFLVTTLEELIIAFPNNHLNVEIKQYGDVGLEALYAVINLMVELDQDYDTFSRIVLASFHEEIYQELVRLHADTYPELMYSPERQGVKQFFILHSLRLTRFYNEPITVLQVPMGEGFINLATRGFVRSAHRNNIAVHYWTINDEDAMRHLIEIGADGIMTDRPNVLRSVLDEYDYE